MHSYQYQFFLWLLLVRLFAQTFVSSDPAESWLHGSVERSSVTVLGHFQARDEHGETHCRLYLKLLNTISSSVAPRSNETLLLVSFRDQNNREVSQLEVSNATTAIDEYSTDGKYSHLMLRADSLGYHRLQLLAYKVYKSFSAIELTLATFRGSPKLRVANSENFCEKNPQQLGSKDRRLTQYTEHVPSKPILLRAKYIGVGTSQFCVLAFLNWHGTVATVVVNGSQGVHLLPLSSLISRKISLAALLLPSRTSRSSLHAWNASVALLNANGEELARFQMRVKETRDDNGTLDVQLEIADVFVGYVGGWTLFPADDRVKGLHRGGAIVVEAPASDDEEDVTLTLASIPQDLGHFSEKIAAEASISQKQLVEKNLTEKVSAKTNTPEIIPSGTTFARNSSFKPDSANQCASLAQSVVCASSGRQRTLVLRTDIAEVEFDTANRTDLRSVTSSDLKKGMYTKKVLMTNVHMDIYEKTDTYSYECLLSENDFSHVEYNGTTLSARVFKTNSGKGATVVIGQRQCDNICESLDRLKPQPDRRQENPRSQDCILICRSNLIAVCSAVFGR